MRFSLLAFCFLCLTLSGCKKDEDDLKKNGPPKACFQAPTSAVHNATVTLDGSCSVAETFRWDFGDGSVSTTQSPDHAYAGSGLFTIKLVVEKNGIKDSISQQITVGLTATETKCKPVYIVGANLWPWAGRSYDSVIFDYGDDHKLNDMRMFLVSGYPSNPSKRVHFGYDAGGKVVEFQFFDLTLFNPVTEQLSATASVIWANDRIVQINWVDGTGYSLRISKFAYDEQGRIADIFNSDGISPAYFTLHYVYGPDGNTAKSVYTGGSFTAPNARVNHSFDTSLPFYSAMPELRLYLEDILFVEPSRNNCTAATLYQFFTWGQTITLGADGQGVERSYTIIKDDNGLISNYYSSNGYPVVSNEMMFWRIRYRCED